MKKLLILLLLTTSFSAFALTLAPLTPCRSPIDIKASEELLVIIAHHNEITNTKINTLIKQLQELKIENENLSDSGLSRSNFAKRRLDIIQLSKEIKQQIKIVESEPYPFTDWEWLQFNRLLVLDFGIYGFEVCKQSPEGSLINNLREGKWTWYNKYNRAIKEGKYINGKKEGQWTEWLRTGYSHDTIEMNYKNDELDGKWVHWYSREHPYASQQRNEREMKTRDKIYFLKADLKSKEVEIAYEEIIAQRELREKDTEKLEDEYKQLEERINLMERKQIIDEFPRMLTEGYYINGKQEGVWKYWDREVSQKSEGSFLNGSKSGTWTYWYSNGKKRSEKRFKNGKKNGTWTYFNTNGQIRKEEIYEDGVLIEK